MKMEFLHVFPCTVVNEASCKKIRCRKSKCITKPKGFFFFQEEKWEMKKDEQKKNANFMLFFCFLSFLNTYFNKILMGFWFFFFFGCGLVFWFWFYLIWPVLLLVLHCWIVFKYSHLIPRTAAANLVCYYSEISSCPWSSKICCY